MSHTISNYGFSEELTNAITHGIGALASVAALTLLVTYAVIENDVMKIISFSIYGASLILMFLMSTLYHAIIHPIAKQVFKLCDHCAIYILIAGTYTPLMLVTLKGPVGYAMCALIWAIAALGVFFKIRFKGRYKAIGVSSYLAMGLFSLVVIKSLYLNLSSTGLILLAVGGAIYALGVIFYLAKNIPFNHAIWHLFVLGGASCHFFMMLHV